MQVAGPLGITHFLLLSATQNASYLRVAKVPRGPTLTMRIHQYALQRDVLTSQQRPRAPKVRRGVVCVWGWWWLRGVQSSFIQSLSTQLVT